MYDVRPLHPGDLNSDMSPEDFREEVDRILCKGLVPFCEQVHVYFRSEKGEADCSYNPKYVLRVTYEDSDWTMGFPETDIPELRALRMHDSEIFDDRSMGYVLEKFLSGLKALHRRLAEEGG